jgi:UTP--glucose-1-phosphate uridylyltransferase
VSETTASAAEAKLRAAGAPEAAVRTFARQLERLRSGESGLLPESGIEPLGELPDAEALADPDPGEADAALHQAVVLKLNGGLGTSMGLSGPKALLEVKEGLTFLDVIAEQVLHLRRTHGAQLPLVLMNSFATRDASLEALARHPSLADQDVPLDFVQGKVPKLRAHDLEPAEHAPDPDLEWAPPGHGDLYPSLVASGMLDALLDAGYRYAFVSNADNLGATLDPRLLTWFAKSGAPLLMEAADRTASDRKGGHLARRGEGLVLREIAQTPEEDHEAFQDTARHRYFNTNSLWLDLRALHEALEAAGGVLDLPLIVNRKTVDPADKASEPVVQLETAMGAAIGALEGAQAIRVPRSRFGPVKTTNDLLAVRSDAYLLGEDSGVALDPRRRGEPPHVFLDDEHYKLLGDFDARFPAGAPSLIDCEQLEVAGDVRFGAGVVVRGRVRVEGPAQLADGTVLEG